MAPDLITRSFEAFARIGGAFTMDKWLFIGLAAVPALAWLWLFLSRQRENAVLVVITFLAGIFAVVPIFALQTEIVRIHAWLGVLGGPILSVLLTSLWVGLYEETAKHWVVKKVDDTAFASIDDAIEFSIIAALGFSFVENILYFSSIWHNPAIDNFWFYYTFRSLGSMFLHVFASGIYGYYYGIAHFAQPVLRDQMAAGSRFPLIKTIHQFLHFKSATVFSEEMILTGLLLAATLHGTFDALMGLSQHFSDVGNVGLAKLFLVAAAPFLVGGYFWLAYLLDKKEDHKDYGHVIAGERTSVIGATEAA